MTITEFLLARIAEDEINGWSASGVSATAFTTTRAFRECEAKRRTVERHRNCGTGYGYCDDGGHGWDEEDGPGCGDLGDLASVYADHPDYRDEWRV